MIKKYKYNQTKFITSAPNIHHLPNDYSIEVAFIGCSNSGKSSALNAVTQQKNLARTSKTPGRTQLINLFEVEQGIRLIDLPGYGYAKAPKDVKKKYQKTLNEYLKKRKHLKGLIMLMDIRHPLKNMDIQIIQYSVAINIPILILLTKADKIVKNKRKSIVITVANKLEKLSSNIQIEIFSSLKRIGIDKLQRTLDEWFSK